MARVYPTPSGRPRTGRRRNAHSELDEILQLAAELGFTGGDVVHLRRQLLRA